MNELFIRIIPNIFEREKLVDGCSQMLTLACTGSKCIWPGNAVPSITINANNEQPWGDVLYSYMTNHSVPQVKRKILQSINTPAGTVANVNWFNCKWNYVSICDANSSETMTAMHMAAFQIPCSPKRATFSINSSRCFRWHLKKAFCQRNGRSTHVAGKFFDVSIYSENCLFSLLFTCIAPKACVMLC